MAICQGDALIGTARLLAGASASLAVWSRTGQRATQPLCRTLITPPPPNPRPPPAEAQYLSDIVAYIKSQPAPVPLAALGTRVKRPEGLKTKAKAFILAHADKLAFDEKAQTVSLKKK